MLSVRNLSAGYSGLVIVNGVDLMVETGALTVLVGANGAGKTTLLKAIAGIIPNEGHVKFNGNEITRASVADRVTRDSRSYPKAGTCLRI